MKILHIIPKMSFGGAEKIALGLAGEAQKNGHEVRILSIMPQNDYQSRLDQAGVGFFSLDYTGKLGLRDVPNILKGKKDLEQYIRSWKPDLIHSHLFISKIFLLGLNILREIPLVHTQHDNSPWWNRSGLSDKAKTYIESRFQRKLAQYTACISDSVKADIQNIGDAKASDRCITIYNFIDLPSGRAIPGIISKQSVNLMMLCRLMMDKKGIDLAINILKELRNDSVLARLILVGKGNDEGKIKKLVAQKELQAEVEFRGYQEDIYSQYQDADIVLMPSRWEGFGLSAAEAAAAAKPVIASRVGGLPEVVLHGETGYLCESENVLQFSERVRELVSDADLYKKMACHAQELAYDRFNIDKAFKQYEQLYYSALAGEPMPV